jgi:hypothetical protein
VRTIGEIDDARCSSKLAGGLDAARVSLIVRDSYTVRAGGTKGESLMETLRDAQVRLIQDKEYEEDIGPYYGKYLGTFLSAHGQVRADLFDAVTAVNAYVSFPTGRNAGNVEDGYVNELYSYAESHGFRERFHFLYM